ncbi:MAG: tRNA pseudouridine synthase [Flavipsychrobacter sp.]|jgi:tRNA pseudouridine38-40 synthase|nr:tRNA pseudouridine synthase [Flavipsychrobacter sp.]
MARYFLEVKYDGTAFHGSQLQGKLPTVQLAINRSLSTLLRKEVISFGASRTDEGVHALCNYYHFDLDEPLHPAFLYKLNAILPPALSVNRMFQTNDPDFNARFAATNRRYRYRIYAKKDPFLLHRALYFPYRLDTALLHETAAIIKEYTDFETFSKRNSQTRTFKCTIFQSYWEEHEHELHYVVEANRFLRGMVRGLVGTQLKVARSQCDTVAFRNIIEARDCTKADFSVAGHGLYLEDIAYPEGSLIEVKDSR